jgi:hypothetical protein
METIKPVDLDVPPLGSILSYRVVWALCTSVKVEGHQRMRATHYATVLSAGRTPIWGVWTINGAFQRFFGSRSAIEDAYSRLVWRKKQSTWTLTDLHDMDHSEKQRALQTVYRKGRVISGEEMNRIKEAWQASN